MYILGKKSLLMKIVRNSAVFLLIGLLTLIYGLEEHTTTPAAEANNAETKIDSVLDKGTTVILRFPNPDSNLDITHRMKREENAGQENTPDEKAISETSDR